MLAQHAFNPFILSFVKELMSFLFNNYTKNVLISYNKSKDWVSKWV